MINEYKKILELENDEMTTGNVPASIVAHPGLMTASAADLLPFEFPESLIHSLNIFKGNIFTYFATGYYPAIVCPKLVEKIRNVLPDFRRGNERQDFLPVDISPECDFSKA